MRILITGAFGFIGRHLLSSLTAEPDAEIYLLDRQSSDATPLSTEREAVAPSLQAMEVDLRDFDQVQRAVRAVQPNIIFHLAAAGVGDPFLAVENAVSHNLFGTINLLRAAFPKETTAQGPQKIIVSRTPGEYTAMNTYAASKAAAWQFCRMYARTQGWPIIGGAIFQAYGPGQPEQRLLPAAITAALNGQDLPMTAGNQQKDWIFVTDVVSGLLAIRDAELTPGTTVELGSGQLTSVAELVAFVYAAIGGLGKPLFGALTSRPGEVQLQQADVDRTYQLINWRAAVPLDTGLLRTIEIVRDSHKQRM